MSKTYTTEELNTLSGTELNQIILAQQEQINTLQANYEKLIEQIRIANQARFGRHSEKLDVIDGQLSLFDEAEAFSDPEAEVYKRFRYEPASWAVEVHTVDVFVGINSLH